MHGRRDIQRANIDDLAAIQDLNLQAFLYDLPSDPRLDLSWTKSETGTAYFRSRIIEKSSLCLLAEFLETAKPEIVGCLTGGIRNIESYRRIERQGELETLFVVEKARRTGIGEGLFKGFRRWAQDQECQELYVSAYFDNTDAIAFYKKQGFRSLSHDLVLTLDDDQSGANVYDGSSEEGI